MIWRLWSYCGETARRSIRPNFSVHPVGKTMRWIEKWMTPFDGLDELYHHAKFGKDRTSCAGCRWENMVFVCFLSRSEAGALFVRRWHTLNRCCVAVYGSILMVLKSFFFGVDCPFKCTREFWLLLLGGATSFAKLRSKISKSPKIGGKVCADDFV